MRLLSFSCVVCVVFCLLLGTAQSKPPDSPPTAPDLVDASVTVFPERGSGSGNIFINGDTDFIWTAGHVVADCENIKTVIDPATGQPKVLTKYRKLTVMQEEIVDGRKVAEHSYLAEIVRYSPINIGDDLALLRVVKKNAFKKGIRFDTAVPKVGTSILHVGSMNGRIGAQSYAEGVFSRAGRLHENKTYDQVTVAALPGSSGGGVFDKKSGLCIGLLTEGLNSSSESINLIVPARVIAAYAKRTHCEWAVDPSVVVPAKDDTPVRDIPLPVPDDYPGTKPGPSAVAEEGKSPLPPIRLPDILGRILFPTH